MLFSCKVDADGSVKYGRRQDYSLVVGQVPRKSDLGEREVEKPAQNEDLVCHLSSISSSAASESMSAFKDGSALLLGAKSGSSSK